MMTFLHCLLWVHSFYGSSDNDFLERCVPMRSILTRGRLTLFWNRLDRGPVVIIHRRDLAEGPERLTANAVVATLLCSIPASSDTIESEGRQMIQCWILYKKNSKQSPFRLSTAVLGQDTSVGTLCLRDTLSKKSIVQGKTFGDTLVRDISS